MQHIFQLINREDWCLSKGIEGKSVNKRTNIYCGTPWMRLIETLPGNTQNTLFDSKPGIEISLDYKHNVCEFSYPPT